MGYVSFGDQQSRKTTSEYNPQLLSGRPRERLEHVSEGLSEDEVGLDHDEVSALRITLALAMPSRSSPAPEPSPATTQRGSTPPSVVSGLAASRSGESAT